jgi:cytoskeleton protein RodZ
VPSIGAKLKQQREKRGITLDEISQSTKISNRFLRALEDDRFDQLPGGIFNKGFVRAYAKSIGLDEDEAVAGYLEATGAAPDKPEPSLPLPEVRPEPGSGQAADLPWGALAIVLLLVALVLVVWGFRNRQAVERKQPTTPVSQNSSPSSETVSVPASSSLSQTITPAAVQPKTPSSLPSGSDHALTAKPSSSAPQSINLKIKAREDSWISITVDGEVMTRDIMTAGTQRSIHASRAIVLKTGNAGALDLDLNGKSLPVQGDIGEVKTLIFDASGFHPAPPSPQAETEPAPPQ